MKRTPFFSAIAASSLAPFVAAALAFGIFVVDTVTDLEIAVAVFYVAVVLMSVSFAQKRGVVLISAGCMALTLLSYFLTPGGSPRAGLINCVISLSAIGATTYLALKIESAEVAMHEARAQLAHISRLTTLGELTTSIAHEINQPLAAVMAGGNACSRWLSIDPPNIEKAKHAAERIVKETNRASEVIKRVRSLAKREPSQKAWVDINETILETLALIRSELESNHVLLRTELDGDLQRVWGDFIQLQQVILNLVINAIEGMSVVHDGSRELLVSSEKDETGMVLVSVRDTGAGVDPEQFEKLFDAFYTTKPEGMGMGLAISRSIIEDHGGRVWASNAPRRGAVFHVKLPIDREDVP